MRAPIGWLRGHIHSMYNYFTAVYNGTDVSPDFKDGAYVNHVMQRQVSLQMVWDLISDIRVC